MDIGVCEVQQNDIVFNTPTLTTAAAVAPTQRTFLPIGAARLPFISVFRTQRI
jgi:hypothetical protein